MADMTVEEFLNSEKTVSHNDRGIIETRDFVEREELYRQLIARIRKYHPNTDISMIEKAYQIASSAHEGQKRKSGEPYIIHPLCVGLILADLELEKVLDIVRLNSISKKGEKKISSNSITDDKKVIDQRADRIDQIIALIKIKGQSVNYFCSIDKFKCFDFFYGSVNFSKYFK